MTEEPDIHTHRPVLQAIAYRMLGSFSEAEDAVQETFLRWHRQDLAGQVADNHGEIREPRAWLITTLTRHCIDRLRAAKAKRETYVGVWLPEPVVDEPAALPSDRMELAESLSMALLMVLERLSPDERAAFLLHEVFETDYPEVARILGKTEPACRQLVHRAKERVREGKPRFQPSAEERGRVLDAFRRTVATGDVAGLAALFAPQATLYSDGGGKAKAALNPVYGPDRIARFFIGVRDKQPADQVVVPRLVNGSPGFVGYVGSEASYAMAIEFDGGRIAAVHLVRNPEKLRHLDRG
ncbi:MAG TPA: RNA polymerase sigma-70 factor [Candidatus Cybelea sp.]|nr:RNA polymerase sigma-70 factor [Candidatus Cybelea sp.]